MCSNSRTPGYSLRSMVEVTGIKSYKTELLSRQREMGTYTPPPSENPTDTELVSAGNSSGPQYFLQQCFFLYYIKEIG